MFGPSKDEVWQPFAEEIGAEFIRGGVKDGWWAGESKLTYHHKGWYITLDTYQDMLNRMMPSYTRVRSPYFTKDEFEFSVHHKSLINNLLELAGFKHTVTGFENFDDEFIVKGNDEQKIKELFAVSRIRYILGQIREFDLKINDGESIFGNDLPKGVYEIYFRVEGVVKDTQKLQSYIDLFCELLEQLYKVGSTGEASPQL